MFGTPRHDGGGDGFVDIDASLGFVDLGAEAHTETVAEAVRANVKTSPRKSKAKSAGAGGENGEVVDYPTSHDDVEGGKGRAGGSSVSESGSDDEEAKKMADMKKKMEEEMERMRKLQEEMTKMAEHEAHE